VCVVSRWAMVARLRPLPTSLSETASVWSSTPILLLAENRAPRRMCVLHGACHAMPACSPVLRLLSSSHSSPKHSSYLSCGHCCVSNATPAAAHRIPPPQARATAHAVVIAAHYAPTTQSSLLLRACTPCRVCVTLSVVPNLNKVNTNAQAGSVRAVACWIC
jgi:hypothetical protein